MKAQYIQGAPNTRFFAKVLKTDSCWFWTAAKKDGYGAFRVNGKTHRAHKWIYEKLRGKVSDGLELDHLCGHRNCVNIDHLEEVTHTENLRRAPIGKRALRKVIRTHCPSGHAYIKSNTYILPSTGERRCRICLRKATERWKAKKS